ncbi:MAG TPA: anhydro-N-acetylmuramic acid kinase [Candidatus Binataceae bacterium]|nr:anhydro-N-acetylmuramic acid kinase [Candidatus Binataceae bacterium]
MKKLVRLGLEGAPPYRAIGLISGTSHDGISAAIVRLDERRTPPLAVEAYESFPYSHALRERLLRASAGDAVGTAEIAQLNVELGRAFARSAIKIAAAANVPMNRISFVGSHGHTFYHLPPGRVRRGETPATLQLGEAAEIAALTGVPVVADFRPMDLALGGEGAPLAPLAHLWLFGDRRRGRVVQNIGGIGNATYLPPRAAPGDRRIIAFDTGPGNGLIDALAARLTDGRARMDRNGRMAARGIANPALLDRLMRHRYFRRRPPKSTGREEFGPTYLADVMKYAEASGVAGEDLVATLSALTARSIGEAIRRFVVPLGPVDELIVTGGGAHNPTLLRMIAAELKGIEVLTAAQLGINGDALEAAAFAILGYQMLRGLAGNIPSVTGASKSAILGKLTLPP